MSSSSWHRLVAAHRAVQPDVPGELPPHEPVAAVLACSDARVPPSVVFDQPAGSLFVVRIAGNTAAPAVVASLDFAVDQLGVDLIVVLGHTGCGAVAAAVSGSCGGHLAPVVAPICDIARRHPGVDPDRISALNVQQTMARLASHDGPTGWAAADGRLELRGAVHDLMTGRLEPVLDIQHISIHSNQEAS